jgi:hypothetical protein
LTTRFREFPEAPHALTTHFRRFPADFRRFPVDFRRFPVDFRRFPDGFRALARPLAYISLRLPVMRRARYVAL